MFNNKLVDEYIYSVGLATVGCAVAYVAYRGIRRIVINVIKRNLNKKEGEAK